MCVESSRTRTRTNFCLEGCAQTWKPNQGAPEEQQQQQQQEEEKKVTVEDNPTTTRWTEDHVCPPAGPLRLSENSVRLQRLETQVLAGSAVQPR